MRLYSSALMDGEFYRGMSDLNPAVFLNIFMIRISSLLTFNLPCFVKRVAFLASVFQSLFFRGPVAGMFL